MGHKRPPFVAKPRVVLLQHLLIPIHQPRPEPMQIVLILKENFIRPLIFLEDEEVDERRLVVGLEGGAALEISSQEPPRLVADGALGPHWRPVVEQIERPLAVPEEEAASVDPDPRVLVEDEIWVPMENEIVRIVLLQWDLENHVGEESITVHPPDPLHLRMRQHQPSDQGQLGPVPGQLPIEVGHVVDDFDPMNSAVIDLVLDGFEKIVVSDGVVAGIGRRSGNEKDPGLPGYGIWVFRVLLEPDPALLVPIGDLGAECVCGVGVEIRLGVGGIVGVSVGSDLGEDAVGFFDDVLLVLGVGGAAAEVADADGAAEDEDGDEAAEDGDLEVVECFLDLTATGEAGAPAGEAGGGESGRASAGGGASSLYAKSFLAHWTGRSSRIRVRVRVLYLLK
eukprot:TRINITY_DN3480_c0_g2_i1.p2 TRINITY_DN3480_c0_g2~~TRINITY_DN3480_c0_g2_i1.p2  ORF type:complete len:395 (+),score=55.19 TRINITY_DN3480_c0_g2_i1:1305-2489(+)